MAIKGWFAGFWLWTFKRCVRIYAYSICLWYSSFPIYPNRALTKRKEECNKFYGEDDAQVIIPDDTRQAAPIVKTTDNRIVAGSSLSRGTLLMPEIPTYTRLSSNVTSKLF